MNIPEATKSLKLVFTYRVSAEEVRASRHRWESSRQEIRDDARILGSMIGNTTDCMIHFIGFDEIPELEVSESALTAAAPFLQGVKVKDEGKLLMDVTQAIFPEGWTMSNRNAVADGIRIVLSAIEPSPSPRAQALEEALQKEKSLSDRLASALEYIDDYCLSYPDLGTISAVAQPTLKAHSDARALSSQPVAGGEYEIDYEVICNGDFVAGSSDLADAKHYAAVYAQDGTVEIIEARTYRRPLPASPGASE